MSSAGSWATPDTYLSLSAGVLRHTCICPGSLKKIEYTAPCSRNKKPGRAELCCAARCGHCKSQQKCSHLQRQACSCCPRLASASPGCQQGAWARLEHNARPGLRASTRTGQRGGWPLRELFPELQLFDFFLIHLLFSLRTLLYSYNGPFDSVAPCFFCLETRL